MSSSVLQAAIEQVERYKPVPFDPRALAEDAGRHDRRLIKM